MAVNKLYQSATDALAGVLHDGMTIMSGGFGLCGIPSVLIEAIRESGVKDLTVISNNAGVDDAGLGLLLVTRQIRKMISSYVGENATFAKQYPGRRVGDRVQPAGHAGRAHPRRRGGHSRLLHCHRRRDADRRGQGCAAVQRPRLHHGTGLLADLAIVHAWKADPEGNLVYRMTARNFNPVMATAAKMTGGPGRGDGGTPGALDPDHIVTAGHLRAADGAQTVNPASQAHRAAPNHPQRAHRRKRAWRSSQIMAWTRDQMAARAARELRTAST